MGGIFGGGGGGGGSTQTVTQSNVPFNAQELNTVQQGAINLGQSNPLLFYPGQIYAPPNDTQTGSLFGGAYNALAAGDRLSGSQVGDLQQQAINGIGAVANGSVYNNASPWFNNLAALGNNNPAATGLTYLNPIGNGSYFTQESPYLTGLANAAAGPGGNVLQAISDGAFSGGAQNYTNGLSDLSNNFTGLANGFGGLSNNLAGLTNGFRGLSNNFTGLGSGFGGLSDAFTGLTSGTAANDLAKTANGAFLNSNPYLTGMFNAAAQPVINAYQTATAPTIDSQMEAAGRFGSGANLNAQSVAQQNLGTTLNNLSSNIFGQDYQNERGLMNQAATNLGSLQTGALQGATGALQGETGAYTGATNALEGATGAYTGATNALQGANSAYAGATNALEGAANNYNFNTGLVQTAANNLGNLNLSGLNAAANQYNSGVDQILKGGTEMGALQTSGQQAQQSALNSALSSLLGFSNQQTNAFSQLPALSQLPMQDFQSANNFATGLQSYDQANINALMQQFYGNEQAPWQTLQTEAGIVGSGIPGLSAVTQPISSNPLGNILGGLGAANSLFGGGGSAGGAGGAGGLFSSGGLFGSQGPLFGADQIFGAPSFDASLFGTGAINSEIGSALGTTVPFTDFAGSDALSALFSGALL